jgi:hypothetical protein
LADIKLKKTLDTIAELSTPSEASHLGTIFQEVDDNNQHGEIDAVKIDYHAVETGKHSSSLKDELMELKEQIALRGNMDDVRQFVAASEKKNAMKLRERSE